MPTSTRRYDPFHQIHQALRAQLYHTSLAVQHTDASNAAALSSTLSKVEELIWLFEGHAHVEDTQVFPLIQAYEPALIADLEAQHVKDHALGNDLEQSIAVCRFAGTPDQQVAALQHLQRILAEFTAFNLTHMNQEQTLVKECLWRYYSDEELHGLTQKIVAGLPPEKNVRYAYWMLKGLALNEIIEWYQAIKATAPEAVFNQFMQLAEKTLHTHQWEALLTVFAEDTVAA